VPTERYVSHTEPNAIIPNRIDYERSTVKADIIADLARLARLLEWRTRLEYGESPHVTGIK
jgi:hypothetical protein